MSPTGHSESACHAFLQGKPPGWLEAHVPEGQLPNAGQLRAASVFPAAARVGRSLPCSEEHPPRRCPCSWFQSQGRTRELPAGTSIRKASAQLQASSFLRSEQQRFLWAAVSLPQSDSSGTFRWLDVGLCPQNAQQSCR